MTTQEHRPRLGLEAAIEKIVPREWTLAHFNPELPAVLSTPAMIGMMEIAAAQAVQAELPIGAITVGNANRSGSSESGCRKEHPFEPRRG